MRGESIKEILWYWLPELISVALLVYAPPIIDSYLIAGLQSTAMLGAVGMASNFLHTIIKLAESIPVAAMAIIGRHNGAKEYRRVGQDLGDTFWTVFLMGFFFFALLYFNAATIYKWIGVPEAMIVVGVPFLKLRSFGVLLTFVFQAFIGFMKGVKNTRVPMYLNICGIVVFVFFDYVLILGKGGFPQMGLKGSALASIFQYGAMNILAIGYILYHGEYRKYFERAFFLMFNKDGAWRLINLSWPIMIDKVSLSFAYVWLAKMLAPLGETIIVSADVIKNLERVAFLPALAFASVVTFLVSNRLGAQDFEGAWNNIKKILLLATAMVACTITVICWKAHYFISCFDPCNRFTDFAAPLLSVVSTLVIFDLVQVILAAALRGAGDVKVVMYGRALTTVLFYMPLAYGFTLLPIENVGVKFCIIYSSFYISNAVMGFVFLKRIVGTAWQSKRIV